MKAFSKRKLIIGLNDFDDINKAEEYIRSYHISLQEKLEIIDENTKLKELRHATADYSPKYQIKNVFKFP